MFDRFSDRSRKLMGLARIEATKNGDSFIGTEHMLLAIGTLGVCTAERALMEIGVDLSSVASSLAAKLEKGSGGVIPKQIPFTPGAKTCLESTLEEASNLGHNFIGTEHVILGLARSQDALVAAAFEEHQLTYAKVRIAIISFLEGAEKEEDDKAGSYLGYSPRSFAVIRFSYALRRILGGKEVRLDRERVADFLTTIDHSLRDSGLDESGKLAFPLTKHKITCTLVVHDSSLTPSRLEEIEFASILLESADLYHPIQLRQVKRGDDHAIVGLRFLGPDRKCFGSEIQAAVTRHDNGEIKSVTVLPV